MCHPYRTLHTSGPVRCYKRSHHSERPMHHNERVAPLTATRESLCTAVKTPSSQNLIFLKDHRSCITFIRHYIYILYRFAPIVNGASNSPGLLPLPCISAVFNWNMRQEYEKWAQKRNQSFSHVISPLWASISVWTMEKMNTCLTRFPFTCYLHYFCHSTHQCTVTFCQPTWCFRENYKKAAHLPCRYNPVPEHMA